MTREVLELFNKHRNIVNRFSIINLKSLREVLRTFTADELFGVELVQQHKEAMQTNKARDAVALFDVIESVDRDRLAGVLAAEMQRAGKSLPVFVQVNIGGEAQKAGIAPAEAVAFVGRCRTEHGLDVVGLMCIPPEGEPAGPYFAHLAALGREAGIAFLSMGMSADFETAIAMGATHVRVGSALFGARP
ncbi:MAG: YggS family pyridoxal phosphate-dependent enzyme [Bauldia sp.]|nr:MAG: YggS family pyridoxal phosphate-dependent enzyme [Bauldia sp.]